MCSGVDIMELYEYIIYFPLISLSSLSVITCDSKQPLYLIIHLVMDQCIREGSLRTIKCTAESVAKVAS
jgi:hypothetical protein